MSLTDPIRRHLAIRDGLKCVSCNKVGYFDPRQLTIDHLIPKCRGGPNSVWNMALMCDECNRNKGGKIIRKFVEMAEKNKGEYLQGRFPELVGTDIEVVDGWSKVIQGPIHLRHKKIIHGCDDCGYTCDSGLYCYVCGNHPQHKVIEPTPEDVSK